MRRLVFIVLLVACKHGGGGTAVPATAPAAQPSAQRELPPAKTGPATHVVTLASTQPTPIMRGPFEIITINPGNDLELGISASASCDGVVWFRYSGGGAAVGDGEVLCARSGWHEPITQGFSGH